MSKGKSEAYLKDQRAFEDYLINTGLEEATLVGLGEVRAGRDLRDIVEQARGVAKVIEDLHSRYARFVVEQAAIGGAVRSQATAVGRAGERKAASHRPHASTRFPTRPSAAGPGGSATRATCSGARCAASPRRTRSTARCIGLAEAAA